MRRYRMKKLLIALTVAIYVINVILFIASHCTPLSLKGRATPDAPYFFEEEMTYLSKITDIAACGDCLYVLYDNISVLSCYDLQGKYICSYYFDMSRNGESQIYRVEETVYLEARGHNIYEFRNGRFIEFYDAEKDAQAIFEIREQLEHSQSSRDDFVGQKYALKKSSIFCVLPNGYEVEFLSRPAWYVLVQNDILFVVVNLAALSVLYFLCRSYRFNAP